MRELVDTWRDNWWVTIQLECSSNEQCWIQIFLHIYVQSSLFLRKSNSHMWACISVNTCVAIVLGWLGSDNTLHMYGGVFGMPECTTFIMVRDFFTFIRKQLKPLKFRKSNSQSIKRMAAEFEALQGISYAIGAIDSKHIPILLLNLIQHLIIAVKDFIQFYFKE